WTRLIQAEQLKPVRADGDDVEPAVLVLVYAAQGGGAADLVQRVHTVDASLAAFTDRDDTEPAGVRPVEQVPNELAVPFLEDVQRQQHARIEHRAERKQRHHLAHGACSCGSLITRHYPPAGGGHQTPGP